MYDANYINAAGLIYMVINPGYDPGHYTALPDLRILLSSCLSNFVAPTGENYIYSFTINHKYLKAYRKDH